MPEYLLAIYCIKKIPIRSYSGPHFPRIWTEFGEMRSIFPFSVRMRENAGQNNSEYGHFLRSDSTTNRW